MERACVICGVIFNAKRSDAEVCSQKCRQKNWRQKKAVTTDSKVESSFEKKVEEYLLSPGNEAFAKGLMQKLYQDVFSFGVGIIKTDADGQQSVVRPFSSEGQKALELLSEAPKTLDDIKARCPADKTGVDRTIWIAEERQKYGI